MVVESFSYEDTQKIGFDMGAQAGAGAVIALTGDLGSGKTVFAKGFAAGLGIAETVNSPTFTIMQVYEDGRLPLYHFDVYRIEEPEELFEIGYEEYFYADGVCLVEWADLIKELMPDDTVWIRIEKDLEKGFDYRRITIE